MIRRLAAMLVLALVSGAVSPGFLPAQGPNPTRKITLEQTLMKGLKVRRPEERVFVLKVVEQVDKNRLSEVLVKAVFQKARGKSSLYPYFYFRQIIIPLAAKQGVKL